jgi:integrase
MNTHRAWKDDRCRWNVHLAPFFGGCRPADVDAAMVRRYVEGKLAEGKLTTSTIGRTIAVFSTFLTDVVEQGQVVANPLASLPRSLRKLYRSQHDTTATPFLERAEDVRRVFLALPSPYNTMFAVGALVGLRTGEVLGLDWNNVDLANRRLHVRQQVHDGRLGPLKDDESRVAPISSSLAPILAAWKLKTGGEGLLFKPANKGAGGRPELGRPPSYVRAHTLHKRLRKALKDCGLPNLTWYQCTRHTFASLFVLGGGSVEVLSKIMGHADISTTQRYAHLRPDLFRESVFEVVKVDLAQPAGAVVSLAPSSGAETTSLVAETPEAAPRLFVTA